MTMMGNPYSHSYVPIYVLSTESLFYLGHWCTKAFIRLVMFLLMFMLWANQKGLWSGLVSRQFKILRCALITPGTPDDHDDMAESIHSQFTTHDISLGKRGTMLYHDVKCRDVMWCTQLLDHIQGVSHPTHDVGTQPRNCMMHHVTQGTWFPSDQRHIHNVSRMR